MMNNPIYTSIVMGSNALKLKIIQYHHKKVHILEDISEPLALGNDIFDDFMIKSNTLHEAIRIIKHFKKAMATYEVTHYRAVATSAIEKATNGLMVLDIIQMKTDMTFEVLEEAVEKGLIYKSLRDQVVDYQAIRRSSYLVSLNSGTCDVSIYYQNKLIKNDEIELGTKAMKSILAELENHTVNYTQEMSQFIKVKTNPLKYGIEQKRLKNFIYMGSFAKHLREKRFGGKTRISKKTFEKLFDAVLYDYAPLRKEVEKDGLDWYEFLTNILTIQRMMSWTKATELLIPEVSLRDGLIVEMLEEQHGIKQYKSIDQDAIHLSRAVSSRYQCDSNHIKHMEKTAITIYESLTPILGFDERDALILRLSAILLDVGKYSNATDYAQVTFDRIKQLSILGLKKSEHLLIAYICRQLISKDMMQVSKIKLDGENAFNTRVNRLSAILGIAYALDLSMMQRVMLEDVKLSKDKLKLYLKASGEMTLEQWYFEKTAETFLQTFDIEVVLRV